MICLEIIYRSVFMQTWSILATLQHCWSTYFIFWYFSCNFFLLSFECPPVITPTVSICRWILFLNRFLCCNIWPLWIQLKKSCYGVQTIAQHCILVSVHEVCISHDSVKAPHFSFFLFGCSLPLPSSFMSKLGGFSVK